MTLLWGLGGGLLGLIAGSFLATLVLRWPRGEAVGSGRSHCDACGATIAVRDLVPLAGFVLLRGRCRTCDARIDPAHVAIEGLCGLVGASALLVAPGAAGLSGALFGWLLVALAALDIRHFWLPDRLVAALLIAGIASTVIGLDPPFFDRCAGLLAGYGILALLALAYRRVRGREGLGGGDAKLLGAIGFMLGWQALPFVLLGASGTGLLIVVLRMARGQEVSATDRLPLGALMALAAFPYWIIQQ